MVIRYARIARPVSIMRPSVGGGVGITSEAQYGADFNRGG